MSGLKNYPLYADWHYNATAERLNEIVKELEVSSGTSLGIHFNIHSDWIQNSESIQFNKLAVEIKKKNGDNSAHVGMGLYENWHDYLLSSGLGYRIADTGELILNDGSAPAIIGWFDENGIILCGVLLKNCEEVIPCH